ncbi:hypothetical protein J1605_023336 [Eschrichtius robustus]|uniref:Uncharacterized protein n=1 Tax=Eschrichtius robustus TaxID=9764 RepID=A0AB34H884_ESCRO|nr:hypothetical protein J1605_023336 [Eschrichtius robustus]
MGPGREQNVSLALAPQASTQKKKDLGHSL